MFGCVATAAPGIDGGGVLVRNHFFITGTDTGVGKTTLSALLCAALDAVYWKPIQTGTLEGSDRVTVMRLAGIGTDRTLDEVYKFVPPVSPDLAARWAGTEIDLARITLPTSLHNDALCPHEVRQSVRRCASPRRRAPSRKSSTIPTFTW